MKQHQPYLYSNEQGDCMLFCQCVGPTLLPFHNNFVSLYPWRIHHKDPDGEVKVIKTSDIIDGKKVRIECNPSLYRFGGSWALSYVVGLQMDNLTPVRYFFVTQAFNLETSEVYGVPTVSDVITFSFTRNSTNYFYLSKDRKQLIDSYGDTLSLPFAYDHLVRVVNIFDTLDLIITIQQGGKYKSYKLDADLNATELKNSAGESVYKCSMHNNKLAYARKVGPNFEDREIVEEVTDAP